MATRAERKAKRKSMFQQQEQQRLEQIRLRAEYERKHPILSGAVKITEYREPVWNYSK